MELPPDIIPTFKSSDNKVYYGGIKRCIPPIVLRHVITKVYDMFSYIDRVRIQVLVCIPLSYKTVTWWTSRISKQLTLYVNNEDQECVIEFIDYVVSNIHDIKNIDARFIVYLGL